MFSGKIKKIMRVIRVCNYGMSLYVLKRMPTTGTIERKLRRKL